MFAARYFSLRTFAQVWLPLKSLTKGLPPFMIIPIGAALGCSRPVLTIVSEIPSWIPNEERSIAEDSLPTFCVFREKFCQKRSPPRRAMKSPAIMISAVEPGLILFLRSSWSNSCTAGSKDEISPVTFLMT